MTAAKDQSSQGGMSFEVNEPILNNPFVHPRHYWFIQEDKAPEVLDGRRPSVVFPPKIRKRSGTDRMERFVIHASSREPMNLCW